MKQVVFWLTLATALLCTGPALAGPYLNTAALLLREGLQSADWLRANLGDKELAKNALRVAEARVDVASHMQVPREVEKAHPHFLLALSNIERGVEAASRGDVTGFLRFVDVAYGEARTFRAILEQLRLSLPSLRDCPRFEPSDHASRSLTQTTRRTLGSTRSRAMFDPASLAFRHNLARR